MIGLYLSTALWVWVCATVKTENYDVMEDDKAELFWAFQCGVVLAKEIAPEESRSSFPIQDSNAYLHIKDTLE